MQGLTSDVNAFLKKCHRHIPTEKMKHRFDAYVEALLKKRVFKDVKESLNLLEKIPGIDKKILFAILSRAADVRLRTEENPEWIGKLMKAARANEKKAAQRHKEILHDLSDAIELLSNRIGELGIPDTEVPTFQSLLTKARSYLASSLKKRHEGYGRSYKKINLDPAEALMVYIFDTAAKNSGKISDDVIYSVGKFYETWGFEIQISRDESSVDLGIRLRQRYRAYNGKFLFSLRKKGGYYVDISKPTI